MDVDLLFEDSTVALRGPWAPTDLVKIGPTADDLAGLFEYHLDFPGHALDPGCAYELWARRLVGDTEPAVYAHVATDAGFPGRLALQYWFFYAFNDFNNTHEGDWEMIQLVFDADDAAEALAESRRPRSGTARTRGRARRLGRREARPRRRHAPRRLPGGGVAREQVHRGALPRQLRGGGRRLRRHARPAPRGPARCHDHPRRSARSRPGVPLDHLRGTLGRAAEGVLQRPHGAEPQDAVDRADRVVRGLARQQLRGPDGRRLRDGRHRPVLLRRRERLRRRSCGCSGAPEQRSSCWGSCSA